jgi:hypothetical protein
MNTWNKNHLQHLQKSGKIQGFTFPQKKKGKSVIPREKPKGIIWLEWNLTYWCNQRALTLEREYKFSPDRDFRSDFAITGIKVLIEYEGGIFMARGGHNSPKGIQRDIDKYQLAQQLGYRVIRVTAKTYTTVLKTLNEMV